MNKSDYTYLINKPDAINERYYTSLEKVVEEFPYLQSARVLSLKHLYNQNSFKYNYALKLAAAFTTDRSVLFNFITSNKFVTVQNENYEQKLEQLLNIKVIDSELVESEVIPTYEKAPENLLEESIKSSIKESHQADEVTVESNLEIGKPLEFSTNEKHSFQEWLQLSQFKPIIRAENDSTSSIEKKKKIELIDKFLQSNPKIPAISKEETTPFKSHENEDKPYLMTETLARVYLEQKKYLRAIQAYEILILKYPEKSSYFADQISEIYKIQQINNS